jgi:hypothetical protein
MKQAENTMSKSHAPAKDTTPDQSGDATTTSAVNENILAVDPSLAAYVADDVPLHHSDGLLQHYAPAEYDFDDPEFQEPPQVASAAVARDLLEQRCGVRVPIATVRRLMTGELMVIADTEPDLAHWARSRFGSKAFPTYAVAPAAAGKPPRVLLVQPDHYDSSCLIGQLNTYGADVFSVEPTRDFPGTHFERAGVRVNEEALRLANTLVCDVAWLDFAHREALLLLTDALLERGVPCVLQPRDDLQVPPELKDRIVVLPPRPMVHDIPARLNRYFPAEFIARLDLTKPLIDDWFDLEALLAM